VTNGTATADHISEKFFVIFKSVSVKRETAVVASTVKLDGGREVGIVGGDTADDTLKVFICEHFIFYHKKYLPFVYVYIVSRKAGNVKN
jgi:hypothetical protein